MSYLVASHWDCCSFFIAFPSCPFRLTWISPISSTHPLYTSTRVNCSDGLYFLSLLYLSSPDSTYIPYNLAIIVSCRWSYSSGSGCIASCSCVERWSGSVIFFHRLYITLKSNCPIGAILWVTGAHCRSFVGKFQLCTNVLAVVHRCNLIPHT